MLYLCPFVVFGSAERQLPKSCEENNLMNKRTLHRLFSVLMAVSYTHLDVYKRQAGMLSLPL